MPPLKLRDFDHGPTQRDQALKDAWDHLDPARVGTCDPAALVQHFQAKNHPWVVAGRVTAEKLLESFLDKCSVGGDLEGRATEREFRDYFDREYPASEVDDFTFRKILEAVWGVADGSAPKVDSPRLEPQVGPDSTRVKVASPPFQVDDATLETVPAGLRPIVGGLQKELAR